VKTRLDKLLVERGLTPSRERAQALILAGKILVNEQKMEKAGASVEADSTLRLLGEDVRYVSRGGLKLERALEHWHIDVRGKICLDVGASTGGFTDCLLQRGALRVYAVDVNVDQLAWKLQQDQRVVRIERNARELRRQDIPDPIDLVVVDVSFISAAKVLAPASAIAKSGAHLLVLVKPQFELPKGNVGTGGIVSDSALHKKAIEKIRVAAVANDLEILGVRPSRLLGAEGNQEYFLHARKKALG